MSEKTAAERIVEEILGSLMSISWDVDVGSPVDDLMGARNIAKNAARRLEAVAKALEDMSSGVKAERELWVMAGILPAQRGCHLTLVDDGDDQKPSA